MPTVQIRAEPPCIWVRIDRPEAQNSIDAALVTDLTNALQSGVSRPDIKLFVLEGSEHTFCTGNDFRALSSEREDQLSGKSNVAAFYDLLVMLTDSPLVTAALVEGKTVAGGVGLMAACDLVYVGEDQSFALTELLFGLLPACVLPFVIRRIGPQRARLMALTTQSVSASTARDWGLVDEVSPDPRRLLKLLMPRLACLDRDAIARLKGYLRTLDRAYPQSREEAIKAITPLLADPEIRQRIRRFVEEGIYPWQ